MVNCCPNIQQNMVMVSVAKLTIVYNGSHWGQQVADWLIILTRFNHWRETVSDKVKLYFNCIYKQC